MDESREALATKVAKGRADVRKVIVELVKGGGFTAHIKTRRNSRLGMVSADGPTAKEAIRVAFDLLDDTASKR